MSSRISRVSLVAALLVFLTTPMVSAEGAILTDGQLQVIKANCVSAQSSIRQLQLSEAATRNNRGRSYESISKLMAALNSRVSLNRLSILSLTVTTTEMEKRFTLFKSDYDGYYDSVTATIKLNCVEAPVTFYDSLTNVRTLRAKVAADIKSVNETLDVYQNGINVDLRGSVLAARSTH